MKNQTPQPPSSDGGLYKGLNVSVKTLNLVIVLGILALAGLVFWGIRNPGYLVTYNSRGGSDVEAQEYLYQEELILPEDPSRQGYIFEGWYEDEGCQVLVQSGRKVEGDLELYACWQAEK